MKTIWKLIIIYLTTICILVANKNNEDKVTSDVGKSLVTINNLIKSDNINVIDTYIFAFSNGWSNYAIQLITFEDDQKKLTNRCYYLIKNHQGEKILFYKASDLPLLLKKFLVIFNQTEMYSKVKIPFRGVIGGPQYYCQISKKKHTNDKVIFQFKALPETSDMQKFKGIEVYRDLIKEYKAISDSVDKSMFTVEEKKLKKGQSYNLEF